MEGKTIITDFANRPYFTKQDLFVVAKKFAIAESSLNTLIQRGIEDKSIIPLKRNNYVVNEFFAKNKNNLKYKYYLSNILLKPSYVSRESALQYYGILTESTANYHTCVTTKATRKFEKGWDTFEYKTMKQELFNGFVFEKFLLDGKEYSFAIARPYKAIFDYIYYKTQKTSLEKEKLFEILDDLRINYHALSKKELSFLISCFK
jgi:predicted transcriptional regulator of viral defense system